MAQGDTNKVIAKMLDIEYSVVIFDTDQTFNTLGIHRREDILRFVSPWKKRDPASFNLSMALNEDQIHMAGLLLERRSTEEICQILDISAAAVQGRVKILLKKFGTTSSHKFIALLDGYTESDLRDLKGKHPLPSPTFPSYPTLRKSQTVMKNARRWHPK